MNKRNRGACAKMHEQILELSKAVTFSEAVKTLGVPRNTLSGYCKRVGISFDSGRTDMECYTDQIVELANQGMNLRQIADRLLIDPSSAKYHVDKLGIKVRNGKFLIENKNEELEVVNLFNQGFTYLEIADKLSIPSKRIPKYLDKHGVDKRSHYDTYKLRNSVNEAAFNVLDEQCAYWLGWMITDGCITDNNSVMLGLNGEDIEIVQTFADYLKPGYIVPLKEYFHKQTQKFVKSASFSVMSPEIANNLRKHNLEARKSCKEKLPNFDYINHELAPVFWRAVIEGDGYIGKDVKNSKVSLVGSEELLRGFISFCESKCEVRVGKKLYKRNSGNPDFRMLEYNGSDARKIMRKLWSSGSIFLERKKKIVQSQLNHWNPIELTT